MMFIIWAFSLFIFFVNQVSAFDIETDGRITIGSQYIFNPPPLHKDFDSSLELHFGVGGNFFKTSGWTLDYEFEIEGASNNGPSEQSNLSDDNDIGIHRSWLDLSKGSLRFRGGRQNILFGSGKIFKHIEKIAAKNPAIHSLRLYVMKNNQAGLKTYQSVGMSNSGYLVYEKPLQPFV